MQTSKKPWESRTLWFNVVSVIAVILVQLRDVPGVDPAIVPYLAVAIPAVNMILRLITTQSLALTAGQPGPDGIAYRPVTLPERIPAPPKGVSFDTGPAPPSAVPHEHNYITPDDLSGIPALPDKGEVHDGK